MPFIRERTLRRKDETIAHYADMMDCTERLAAERDRLSELCDDQAKRIRLLEKAVKSYSMLKLELGADLTELRAENTRLKAENDYLNKVVDAAAEGKEFLRVVFESEVGL